MRLAPRSPIHGRPSPAPRLAGGWRQAFSSRGSTRSLPRGATSFDIITAIVVSGLLLVPSVGLLAKSSRYAATRRLEEEGSACLHVWLDARAADLPVGATQAEAGIGSRAWDISWRTDHPGLGGLLGGGEVTREVELVLVEAWCREGGVRVRAARLVPLEAPLGRAEPW